MKRIGITQRVDIIPNRNERRDALDQRFQPLAAALGVIGIPLPNLPFAQTAEYCHALTLDGIILSGGNSLHRVASEEPDCAPERDAFEYALLDYADSHALPVFGICRGMQAMNLHANGMVVRVEGHVATRHPVSFQARYAATPAREVNSYHNWGIAADGLANVFTAFAIDRQGNIEGLYHPEKKQLGVMWHPEREAAFHEADIALMKEILQ